jgi:hypothetical protein
MLELQLELTFFCGACEESLAVTVQCSGKGLADGPATVAAALVPCPACHGHNQVCFHPTGTVVTVRPVADYLRRCQPSPN